MDKPLFYFLFTIVFMTRISDAALINIAPSDVTASSQIGGMFNRQDDFLVDGSGLSGGGHNITPESNMWLSIGNGFGGIDPNPSVLFNFGSSYQVNSIQVWNYNEFLSNRGVNGVTIEYSTDNMTFTPIAGITNLAQASGSNGDTGEVFNAFAPFVAQYVRFDINSNHGDSDTFYGLSEVQFDGTPVPEPSSLFLIGLGGFGLSFRRRQHKQYN